jgi:ATP synthase subunit 6
LNFLDPLEQFEFGSFFCAQNAKFVLFLYLVTIVSSFCYFVQRASLLTGLSVKAFITRRLFSFVLNILRESLKTKYGFVFANLLNLFLFILLSNLIGMSPYTITLTSAVVLTFFLSFQFFFGISLFGVIEHRSKVTGFFLPNGVPLVVAPFLVVIEMISYFARVLSLAIRLFANIMSGHSLLKILAGFV